MATRHQVRQAVISLLYADEYLALNRASIFELLEDKKIRNKQKELSLSLFDGVLAHTLELDVLLNSKLKDYKIDKVSSTERAILRLGCFELFHTNTDFAVVVNEAILLAKEYGSDNSAALINAILDALEKERIKSS